MTNWLRRTSLLSIMKSSILVICMFLAWYSAAAQTRVGMECYGAGAARYTGPASRIYLQNGQGNYSELRYNYDAERTLGVSVGHSFKGGTADAAGWSVAPMIGLVAGAAQGLSIGVNATLERGSFSCSSANQLIGSTDCRASGSFYTWSDLGKQMAKYLYVGITFQASCYVPAGWLVCVGPELRLCFRDWLFPVYFFQPAGRKGYLFVGIEREWSVAGSMIHHQKRTEYK